MIGRKKRKAFKRGVTADDRETRKEIKRKKSQKETKEKHNMLHKPVNKFAGLSCRDEEMDKHDKKQREK